MATFYVVAEYRDEPAEGMQVVSKTLVDGLRNSGLDVEVLAPDRIRSWLPRLLRARKGTVVFTHGPGRGVVLASAILRRLSRMRIIWVATRPDLQQLPRVLQGHRTAHAIVGNRKRSDLDRAATDHQFFQQYIGIDPQRLSPGDAPREEVPSSRGPYRLLHIGHLRPNRGLDLLVDAKNELGGRIEVIVQGSPTFAADPEVLASLEDAGVEVRRQFVEDLGALYRTCDLYVFPARPEAEGAIELPLGVLEAVACGRPVLTNDFGAVREALSGVPGVHIATPETFVGRLREIVTGPVLNSATPPGLPDFLNAARVADAVRSASEGAECV